MKKFLIFLLLLFLLGIPVGVKATNSSDVVTNEIAWMGTTASANDEWLELYNTTNSPITLDGWALKASNGTPNITLTGTIPANGFYLLERTNDDTIPGILADKIYTGALENSGENLKLYDNLNNLVDEVNCSGGWFAGDNKTKQTMERAGSADWQTSENPGGTPKSQNSAGVEKNSNDQNVATQEQPTTLQDSQEVRPPGSTVEAGPPLTYSSGVVFNEILPSPEGPDETEEWIEIYNQNSFEVNLSNWQIQDSEGSVAVYIFPDTTLIKQKGYLVFTRPTTKIVLNNTGDRLTLLNPGKEISDAITYAKSPNGQSYNRINNEWQWSNALTPGLTNIIKNVTMEKTKESANNLSRNILEDKLITAALNREPKQSKSFLFAFLTALIIAFILTTIFLFLKTRLNNK